MEYKIHENNLSKLKEKLNRIEKKCNKYGNIFHFSEVGEEFQEVQHYKELDCGNHIELTKVGIPVKERFIIVDVEGKAIINNWEFIATIEHTEHGNIIRSYSDIEIPEYYRTCKPHCDHCNTNRYRKDTYLIRNTKTGDLKQVGKSCLMDYTHGLDSELVTKIISYYQTIEELNNHESLGGYCKKYLDTKEYLLNTIETTKKLGFISKSKVMESGKGIPTTTRISNFMSHNPDRTTKELMSKINYEPDTEENKKELENLLLWLENQEVNSQYISNLKIACKNQYSEWRDTGILASLPAAYFKAQVKEKTKNEKNINQRKSEYVGNIKDKICKELTYIKSISYEVQYGYYPTINYIHLFEDENGNKYKWNTSKLLIIEDKNNSNNNIHFSEGDKMNIKGTIKAHTEYKDEKQTELTRCKIF